jgi:iron complex transport system permease protein
VTVAAQDPDAAAGRTARGYWPLIGGLAAVLAVLALASMMIGPAAIGFSDLLAAFGRGEGGDAVLIMREIRLPRTLLAVLVGASLGLAGASLQGFLRNPLAEPGVIGVSGSAALGAVIAIYTGLAAVLPLALPAFAILGALGCVFVLQFLAGRGGALSLILAGVAIASLAGALTSLALNLSPNPYAALEIVFWMLGSLADRSMTHVALAAPFMIGGWALLAVSARSLDVLSLGEETAASLGVNLARVRWLVVLGAAVSVGAATAVTGVIGFVGLVAPHVLRPFVGHKPSRLLLASALGGAILLVASDILVRLITPGTELRLGVVTALIGAPFFLHLVVRARSGLEP